MHGQDQGEKQGGQGLKVVAAYQERGSRDLALGIAVDRGRSDAGLLCHTCLGHSTQTTICALPGGK